MPTLADYNFELPEELIATRPLATRSASRLLCQLNRQPEAVHDHFRNIVNHLNEGDILVINNTKVMKARICAFKPTGSRVDILLIRAQGPHSWAALMNGKGPFLPKTKLHLPAQGSAQVIEVVGRIADEPGAYELTCTIDLLRYCQEQGQLPLPPYFRRLADEKDDVSYQTIFATDQTLGAVAAPTAGLHFCADTLADLARKNITTVEVTLHVGPGTFLPIREENIANHKMHAEFFSMSPQCAHALNQARRQNQRIVAVGTTAVRVLEQVMQWAAEKGVQEFFACEGKTAIFIKPGYQFLGCDALITNFHLPKSTLLLLVSAVLGREKILNLYKVAIEKKYRFFSYGDACYFEITGPKS